MILNIIMSMDILNIFFFDMSRMIADEEIGYYISDLKLLN